MPDEARHAAWIRVVERIYDEHVHQAWRQHLYRLVRAVFTANSRLADEGGFIFNWAVDNYIDASLMLVRRELDTQAGTENIRHLLEDIIEHYHILDRTRYRGQWSQQNVELADFVFDSFTPARVNGSPERDHVDPEVVKADLDNLVKDSERLRTFAERTRAHRTPSQGIETTITFGDLHLAIMNFRAVVGKYYALLTLKSATDWVPTPLFDPLSAFLKPWILDPEAVLKAMKDDFKE